MENKSYRVIGVMSGTSLDGIDLCYINFRYDNRWHFNILHAETISYSKSWKKKLNKAFHLGKSKLDELDMEYTLYLSDVLNSFIKNNGFNEIDLVCSHGHTVFHEPDKGITKQIGNRPELARQLGKTVVCDFRVDDVHLGGQGAPLVPIGDRLLFPEFEYCLNLGGFANISFEHDSSRCAFDVCPVNIVINHYAKMRNQEFDRDGLLARSGTINEKLLNALNALPYYGLSYPKSLGYEWVSSDVFPLIDSFSIRTEDLLRTFVEHVAVQIANVTHSDKSGRVLVTGGGVFNRFLLERIKKHAGHTIIIPSEELVNFKEALIFGLLGVLKLRGESNCLSSVTGAKHDHSSGRIYLP